MRLHFIPISMFVILLSLFGCTDKGNPSFSQLLDDCLSAKNNNCAVLRKNLEGYYFKISKEQLSQNREKFDASRQYLYEQYRTMNKESTGHRRIKWNGVSGFCNGLAKYAIALKVSKKYADLNDKAKIDLLFEDLIYMTASGLDYQSELLLLSYLFRENQPLFYKAEADKTDLVIQCLAISKNRLPVKDFIQFLESLSYDNLDGPQKEEIEKMLKRYRRSDSQYGSKITGRLNEVELFTSHETRMETDSLSRLLVKCLEAERINCQKIKTDLIKAIFKVSSRQIELNQEQLDASIQHFKNIEAEIVEEKKRSKEIRSDNCYGLFTILDGLSASTNYYHLDDTTKIKVLFQEIADKSHRDRNPAALLIGLFADNQDQFRDAFFDPEKRSNVNQCITFSEISIDDKIAFLESLRSHAGYSTDPYQLENLINYFKNNLNQTPH